MEEQEELPSDEQEKLSEIFNSVTEEETKENVNPYAQDENLLDPLPMTRQIVLRQLAKFSIGTYGDDMLYIVKSIKQLIGDPNITDQPLKDFYGDKYKSVMDKLNDYHFYLLYVKKFYDKLDGQQITEDDIKSRWFQEFGNAFSKLPLYDVKTFEIFYILVNATTLRDKLIPAEYLAEERKKYKSFEIKEEQDMRERQDKRHGMFMRGQDED